MLSVRAEEMPHLSHCDELTGIVLGNDALECFLQVTHMASIISPTCSSL